MLTEKRCLGPCGLIKSVDDFHWKSKRRGHRQARCKDCSRQYSHVHYIANSDEYKERANTRLKALRLTNRDLVKTFISDNPCSKCGETNPKVLTTSIKSSEINNIATADLAVKLVQGGTLCRNCIAAVD